MSPPALLIMFWSCTSCDIRRFDGLTCIPGESLDEGKNARRIWGGALEELVNAPLSFLHFFPSSWLSPGALVDSSNLLVLQPAFSPPRGLFLDPCNCHKPPESKLPWVPNKNETRWGLNPFPCSLQPSVSLVVCGSECKGSKRNIC